MFEFTEMTESLFIDEDDLSNTEKFVTFYLNNELFGVASKNVAEVTRTLPIAFLPNSPDWLSGIANLRGEVVPVLNLPKLLEKEPSETSQRTKFVVLQAGDSAFAFVVDKLSEIVTLQTKTIEPVQEKLSPNIFGKADYKSNSLFLIDADRMLSSLVLS